MTVLLTGATGTLGRLVLPRLRAALAGEDVRTLSRRPGPDGTAADLSSGTGVLEALTGVRTVVHCAGSAKGDGEKAQVLVDAARRAGVEHVVLVSVVGCDRLPVRTAVDRAMFGYYASKVAAEEVVSTSGTGWTTLRATQFHDLVLTLARALTKGPVAPVPAGWHVQPVDADEVAARLVELAVGEPAGLVEELGGPQVHDLGDLVRGYLAAAGTRRVVVRPRLPGGAARAFAAGSNLTPDHAVGVRTWEQFLAERVPGSP